MQEHTLEGMLTNKGNLCFLEITSRYRTGTKRKKRYARRNKDSEDLCLWIHGLIDVALGIFVPGLVSLASSEKAAREGLHG